MLPYTYVLRGSCIAQVFKLDPDSVRDLFLELRGRSSKEFEGHSMPQFMRSHLEARVEPEARRMWAMIEVRYAVVVVVVVAA